MYHDNLLCALLSRHQPIITPTTTLSDQDDARQQQQEELTIRRSNSRRSDLRQHSIMNNNKAACSRQRQVEQVSSRKLAPTKPGGSPTIWLCLAAAALILAISFVGADHAAQQPQQQSTDTHSNGGYDQQQQQQQQATPKAKKIQIVYIKVPLAKLKPSLANSADYTGSASNADNSTYAGQHNSTDNTTTRIQGSQSVVDHQQYDNQQQQLSRHQQPQRHESSFVIPMAVVSNHEQHEQSAFGADSPLPSGQNVWPMPADPSAFSQQQTGFNLFDGTQMMHDERTLMGPMHYGPMQQQHGRRRSPWVQPQLQQHPQSPMHFYHQLMAASASNQSPMNSVSHGINHGFMSSFLMAEKEKMTAAAMRVHQQHLEAQKQQQQQHHHPQNLQTSATATAPVDAMASASSNTNSSSALLSSSSSSSSLSSSSSYSPSTSNDKQTQTLQSTPSPSPQTTTRQTKQSPGGLMPVMMVPFSHMPDSMIGQAYNAAVGQALPVESGSPANLLGSPSSQQDHTSKRENSYATGGNTGTSGDSGSWLGTTSNGSYGANGPSQLDNGAVGNAYPPSGSGSANYGPSSGSGSGTNTFGASVAFLDFPATQSIGSGHNQPQQGYGFQQQLPSNNNPHHSPSSGAGAGGADQSANNGPDYGMSQNRLRQAKKTIIPIVVQVEHAILENNQANQAASQFYQQGFKAGSGFGGGNKYQGGRGNRPQYGGKRGGRKSNEYRGHQQQQQQVLYGAASNESPMDFGGPRGQYINAANAQDISKITAAINAENAASAAAALAQADMVYGDGAPAFMRGAQHPANNQRPHPQQQQHHHHQHMGQHHHQQAGGSPGSQYASSLQSAASALLANTHPVIQAAASGGLASVTKLGAKLGEMIALPSMSMPGSIASIGSSLPSALSSMTNQMGIQLNQAVQQVAKEHPTAHAFARQVAQHAGLNLPNFNGANLGGPSANSNNMNANNNQYSSHQNNGNNNQHQMAASFSSGQQQQQQQQQSALSPQAQLQNFKLSVGQNLQMAASQLMGVSQKENAQSAATLLANPLAALYPQSMNAALKQLSSSMAAVANQQQQPQQQSSLGPQQQQQQQQQHAFDGFGQNAGDSHYAQSSSFVPIRQTFSPAAGNQQQGQISQFHQQMMGTDSQSPTSQSALVGEQASSGAAAKPGKSSLKSKFLSFFQPPKFISNLLSWNDRADDRNDQGSLVTNEEEEVASDEGSGAARAMDKSLGADKKEDEKSSAAATSNRTSLGSASVVSNGTSEVQQLATAKGASIALDSNNNNNSSSASTASASSSAPSSSTSSPTNFDEKMSAQPELEASPSDSSPSKKN